MLDLNTGPILQDLLLLSPPIIGTKVQFHHPHTGWTWGIVRKIVLEAEDLEDVPHWGVWLTHPILGKVWALGSEIIVHNDGKQIAVRHI